MSALHEVWQHVEHRVKQRVVSRKLRHARFWKLHGAEAKKAVIEGAVARLMAPDAVFPYALRKRLAPRALVAKGAPAGWLGSWRPINSTLWAAWIQVHHQYIEHGDFWYENCEAADALVDAAIDAERGSYCEATADSDGPTDGKLDPELSENLSRLTEAGQAFATEPSREFEHQNQLDAEAAALEYRAQIEAEENAKLQQAVEAYGRTLRREQRRALKLICTDLSLTGAKIAVRCRVSEATVSKIRANVEELADQILTIPTEEGSSNAVEAPAKEVPHDEMLSQIAEAWHSSAALDLAALFQAPDVDADVSESVLANYARRNGGSAVMRDNWSGGRRRYSEAELVTGSRYGGRYDDPAKIAERDARKQHANKFSDVELRELHQKAATAGVALKTFLQAIDSFLMKRAAESVDDSMAATIAPK
jgi:hypothetical protein